MQWVNSENTIWEHCSSYKTWMPRVRVLTRMASVELSCPLDMAVISWVSLRLYTSILLDKPKLNLPENTEHRLDCNLSEHENEWSNDTEEIIYVLHYFPTNHIWSYKYKIYMGTPCKPYGDPTLKTHKDLQKVYTLNKYNFPYLFIIRKPSKNW